MFIGREKELAKLNSMYNNDKFECAIIYGRRRVGKTTLIREFIKDKKAIYFAGTETGSKSNLRNLSKSIFDLMDNDVYDQPSFDSFQSAFDYIYKLSKNERLIFIIDEYPYLAQSYKGVSSILQIQIDLKFMESNLFLIICGSSMSFMENQVLSYQSPLYGRRTAQFKIKPFTFFESIDFHKKLNVYDNAIIYGITGGIPQYLTRIDDSKDLKTNIIDNFLDPNSYMFEEPSNLLKQELREPQMYNEIIASIATGSSRLNEISTKAGIETSACNKYLSSLISLGIIKKEQPVLTESSKKTIYRVEDNMFRFWYRFIPQNISLILTGALDKVYKRIESQIPSFMGEVFEEICKQYIWKMNVEDKTEFLFSKAGRWWGTNPIKKSEEEIDIIAFDDDSAIFCECKWTNIKVASKVLDSLIEKSLMFNFKNKYYYIFSKSGFSNMDKKLNNNVKLIEFKDMIL